jgi:hypothetical protein
MQQVLPARHWQQVLNSIISSNQRLTTPEARQQLLDMSRYSFNVQYRQHQQHKQRT